MIDRLPTAKNRCVPERTHRGCRQLSSETVAAVYRAVAAGLEWNLAGFSALCAYRIIHLTAAFPGVSPARVTAGFTALWFVCKAFFSKKLLLAGSKREFLSAIFADQGFVVVHEIPLN